MSSGAQRYQAVKYCSFEVGPFSVKLVGKSSESVRDLKTRGRAMLATLESEAFKEELENHLDRVRTAKAVGARSGIRQD